MFNIFEEIIDWADYIIGSQAVKSEGVDLKRTEEVMPREGVQRERLLPCDVLNMPFDHDSLPSRDLSTQSTELTH